MTHADKPHSVNPAADVRLLRAAFDAGVYAGGMADPRVTDAYLDEQFAEWLVALFEVER